MDTPPADSLMRELIDLLGNSIEGKQKTVQESELDRQLEELVRVKTPQIYTNAEELRAGLAQLNVDERTIYKLCLLTTVTGFDRLLESEGEALHAGIDMVIVNALEETSINRLEILRLLYSVLASLGTVFDFGEVDSLSAVTDVPDAFVVPYSVYEKDLNRARDAIAQARAKGIMVDHEVIEVLEPLVAMGIPKAQYLMAVCIIRGLSDKTESRDAFELLTKAAGAGDTEAVAELGDYYYDLGINKGQFDGWQHAYECYTGYGSLAFTYERRRRTTNIIKQKEFNDTTFKYCLFLLIGMALLVLTSPGAPTYASHTLEGLLAVVVGGVVFALGYISHKKKPYNNDYILPVVIFVILTIYLAVRFFFY